MGEKPTAADEASRSVTPGADEDRDLWPEATERAHEVAHTPQQREAAPPPTPDAPESTVKGSKSNTSE
jgi:hypothetical protein